MLSRIKGVKKETGQKNHSCSQLNRRFPEITGEIIWKCEAPAVGHHCRHRLLSMISEWRRQSKSAGLWQYQTFRHGPIIYWTARCATRYALETLFFFRILQSFGQGHMLCVCLEWWTDWIDCEHSLFTLCSSLRRRAVKKNHWYTSNTEPGIVKPVALFHHLHWIVDSSWQSSLQVSHLKIASNMVSSEVLIISRINCYLNRSTALSCVSAWSDMSIRTSDIRRVV